ncbi:TRAP transporter permease [Desulfatitalea alkaliphila]|uniref:TRAP transporter fused permease subunit n=1 Tax=Desulfatitalea alkaliphila TaxID=2929485 RepID=A0AA41R6E0_9BACT|nr:TRAP transporter fused permease subunit [Desulfatitalea alkaliphila]MCJ8499958.1 TRAP transporter fused permease subunit [Desulfatitalea alkaliphila]
MDQNKGVEKVTSQVARLGALGSWQSILFSILSIAGILLAVYHIFGFTFRGKVFLEAEYYWLFIGIFSAATFIYLPARKRSGPPPWYDLLLAAVSLGICFYFFLNSRDMILMGWSNIPLGIVIWVLMMETARRAGGIPFFLVVLLLGMYPLAADSFPGLLRGINYTFDSTMESHIFRSEGMMGITTKIVAEIILGFLVFAGVLLATGAGDFFIDLANSIFGKFRGGPAKVSVVASGFFGSLSGSVFSNIVGTGSITIRTMKKTGFPPHYAGAIESCASTGGTLMPPVMGAIAFVMAVTVGVEYRVIMVSAIIPSFLFYLGLLLQVDAYAAKTDLQGLPKEEIPSMWSVLRKGWPFLTVLIFLIWGLLVMRWEYLAPWYASLLMIGLSFLNRNTWMTPAKLFATIRRIGELITQTAALILPVAFVVSALTITGVTGSMTSGLLALGGGNMFLILLLGIIACYIMGMAGLMIVAYIFLAVTLAPAIIAIGDLNPIAVHLFIVYYAMLAGITPPVAAAAFLGAAIAGAAPMKTAMTAMRLGIVIYFVPFFFIFQPALVLQGNLWLLTYVLPSCILGIMLICAGSEGYLLGVGKVPFWMRLPLVGAGFLLSFPTPRITVVGLVLSAILVVALLLYHRKAGATEPSPSPEP